MFCLLAFVPAVVSLFCILFLSLWTKYRNKSLVVANCWFCNEDSKVPFLLKNSWNCPKCEQYNGFNKDGDYNKVIDAQFNGSLNKKSAEISLVPHFFKNTLQSVKNENQLCAQCNDNQALKAKQLAQFVPSCEDRFDIEVEQFRVHLEKVYRLCGRCSDVVRNELYRQHQTYGFAKNIWHVLQATRRSTFSRTGKDTAERTRQDQNSGFLLQTVNAKTCLRLRSFIKIVSFAFAFTGWVSVLDHLQQDSKTEMVSLSVVFPTYVLNNMPVIYDSLLVTALVLVALKSMCFYVCRRLGYFVSGEILCCSAVAFSSLMFCTRVTAILFSNNEDCLMTQLASMTVICWSVTWTLIAPLRKLRKCKRKRSISRLDYTCTSTLCSSTESSPASLSAVDSMRRSVSSSSLPSVERELNEKGYARQDGGYSKSNILGSQKSENCYRDTIEDNDNEADGDDTFSFLNSLRIGTPVPGAKACKSNTSNLPRVSESNYNYDLRSRRSTSMLQTAAHRDSESRHAHERADRSILSPARLNVNNYSPVPNYAASVCSFASTKSQFGIRNPTFESNLFGSSSQRGHHPSSFRSTGLWLSTGSVSGNIAANMNNGRNAPSVRSFNYQNSEDDTRSVTSTFTSVSNRQSFQAPKMLQPQPHFVSQTDLIWKVAIVVVMVGSLLTNAAVVFYLTTSKN